MQDPELRRRLEDLHRELATIDKVEPDLAPVLEELRADIEAVLERAEPRGLGELLEESLEHFEVSHPRLAGAIGAVIDQLAKIGI